MSYKLHLALTLALQFIGFFGGAVAFMAVGGPRDAGMLWFFVLPFAGALIPRFLMRHLVPARCPECDRVSAYQRGSRPLRYECRSCGHTHHTSVSEGRRRYH